MNDILIELTPFIFTIARSVTTHLDFQQDLVQVGLERAWKCIPKYEGGAASLNTFLYKPIKWAMFLYIKNEKGYNTLCNIEYDESLSSSFGDPVEEIVSKQIQAERFLQRFDGMKEIERDCLTSTIFSLESYEDLAKKWGRTEMGI